jgi:predicted XRE-type DNA-binding protein
MPGRAQCERRLRRDACDATRVKHDAKNGSVSARQEPPEVKLKRALMACIDEGIRKRYRTLQEAAHVSKINRELLSRVRHGEHRRCSIASLLSIAERLRIHIKIEVQLVNHIKWQ